MPWKPANGRHSIERATVSFFFRDGLTAHAHGRVLAVIEPLAIQVGLAELMILPPPLQLNFVQAGSGPAPVPQAIAGPPQGRAMRRKQGNKVVEELVLTSEAVVYTSYEYDRWKGFRERIASLLPEAIKCSSSTTPISEARLEYWDRFDRHPDGSADAPLVNPGSNLIGPALRDESGSWHSHIGFFSRQPGEPLTLVNANIDAISSTPNSPQKFTGGVTGQARIYTLASIQMTGDDDRFENWQTTQTDIDRVHYLLKSVLADVIHPDIATAIHLNAEPLKLGQPR